MFLAPVYDPVEIFQALLVKTEGPVFKFHQPVIERDPYAIRAPALYNPDVILAEKRVAKLAREIIKRLAAERLLEGRLELPLRDIAAGQHVALHHEPSAERDPFQDDGPSGFIDYTRFIDS